MNVYTVTQKFSIQFSVTNQILSWDRQRLPACVGSIALIYPLIPVVINITQENENERDFIASFLPLMMMNCDVPAAAAADFAAVADAEVDLEASRVLCYR